MTIISSTSSGVLVVGEAVRLKIHQELGVHIVL